jgi:hypothetical protein
VTVLVVVVGLVVVAVVVVVCDVAPVVVPGFVEYEPVVTGARLEPY